MDRISSHALERARAAGWPPGQDVGQQSFMTAAEIRRLADEAGIGAGVTVLDVCCGAAGPGRMLASERGCDYHGVDQDAASVAIARRRCAGLPCRFSLARVPPLPPGRFRVVLLLETLLAFPDKRPLLAAIAAALEPDGRFAFTLESGAPLTAAERGQMPAADTVWPTPPGAIHELLDEAGLSVRWQHDSTAEHAAAAAALARSYAADADRIAADIGTVELEDLLAAHRLWAGWLSSGRVRKYAMVAEAAPSAHRGGPAQYPDGDGSVL